MTTLFDVLADGSDRTYFDELVGAGVSVATAHAAVGVSAQAAGVVLGAALSTVVLGSAGIASGGFVNATANASVTIGGACVDNLTYVYINPAVATVEVFGSAGQANVPRAVSSIAINGTAVAAPLTANANAAIAASARAQALVFGVATASVVISGTAAGNGLTDQFTSPATAQITWSAGATPRNIGYASGSVSIAARAAGAISISVGIANASVTVSAQAAESAGVIEFPRATASVSISGRAAAAVISAPARALLSVTGRSIDWKTIADAYNSQQPPVPEYEFGYGKARRTFKQR